MPSPANTPWWLEPDENGSTANANHDRNDDVSVDDSLYIDDGEEDSSDAPVVPDSPYPQTPLEHRHQHQQQEQQQQQQQQQQQNALNSPRSFLKTERIPLDYDQKKDQRLQRSSKRESQPPPSSSSPSKRKTLQELSASVSSKLSKSTRNVSRTLSKQWKSMTASSGAAAATAAVTETDIDIGIGHDASSVDPAVTTTEQSQEQSKSASPPRRSLFDSVSQSMANTFSGRPSSRDVTEPTHHHHVEGGTSRSNSGRSSSTSGSNSNSNSNSSGNVRQFTVKELIQSLGQENMLELPPALERRVRDFKFAQGKRRERHGEQKPWGIFGLYAHLSDIRADLEWAEDAAWRRQRSEPYLSWTDFEKSRDKGLHNRPWFTYGTIFICTIMLLVTIGVNGWKFEPLNVNPLIGPSSETLIKVGARDTDLIVNEGQWFRLFSPLVLHAGLVHYFINMAALYFIGGAVEQSHGFCSAAVLFIIPAVGGNILSAICLPQYISVGASGGIFGLIGGCLADISINWNLLFLKSTTDEESRKHHFMVLFWLAFDMLLNCIIGFTPFVDNFTHLGGFLYGLCCGLSTIERLAVGFFGLQSGKYSTAWNTFLRFSGLIVSVISIMVTTVVLVQSDGVTSACHGCRYISCVPFPPRSDEKWWYCDDCDFVTADLFVDQSSGQYEQIDLTCPDGQVEEIDVGSDAMYDKEDVRRALPTYCRQHCDEVFANKN